MRGNANCVVRTAMCVMRCATCQHGKGESSSLQIQTTCNRKERKGKARKGRKEFPIAKYHAQRKGHSVKPLPTAGRSVIPLSLCGKEMAVLFLIAFVFD